MGAPSSPQSRNSTWPPHPAPSYRSTLISAIASCVGIIVGSLTPWAIVLVFTINGLDAGWWGVTTLTAGVLALGTLILLLFWSRIALEPRWSLPTCLIPAVLGIGCLAISLPFLVRVMTSPRTAFFGMPIGPAVGWGLWLLTLSSAVLAVSSGALALQVTAAVESLTPIGQAENTWTQSWPRSAIVASAVIVLASVTYFALNWQYDADIDDESSPPLPSFPSHTAASPSTTTTTAVTTDATLGLACTDHDKIEFDPTSGQEIACMERFSPSYGWFWRETPPMEGVHERDTSCEGQRAWSNSRTPDDYLIHCLPADIASSSPIAGPGSLWKPPANV